MSVKNKMPKIIGLTIVPRPNPNMVHPLFNVVNNSALMTAVKKKAAAIEIKIINNSFECERAAKRPHAKKIALKKNQIFCWTAR